MQPKVDDRKCGSEQDVWKPCVCSQMACNCVACKWLQAR